MILGQIFPIRFEEDASVEGAFVLLKGSCTWKTLCCFFIKFMCQDLADLFFPCLQLKSYLKFNFTKRLKIATPLNLHIIQAALKKLLVKCSSARKWKVEKWISTPMWGYQYGMICEEIDHWGCTDKQNEFMLTYRFWIPFVFRYFIATKWNI